MRNKFKDNLVMALYITKENILRHKDIWLDMEKPECYNLINENVGGYNLSPYNKGIMTKTINLLNQIYTDKDYDNYLIPEQKIGTLMAKITNYSMVSRNKMSLDDRHIKPIIHLVPQGFYQSYISALVSILYIRDKLQQISETEGIYIKINRVCNYMYYLYDHIIKDVVYIPSEITDDMLPKQFRKGGVLCTKNTSKK